MIFSIHKEKLKDGLDKIRHSLSTGSANILLEHFLFKIEDGNLAVKATNINTYSVWDTRVESEGNFSFTVAGSNFCSLVSSLENGKINFEYNDKEKKITLSCAKYTWEAISGNVDNFPDIRIPEDNQEYNLPKNFNNFLKKVFISISKDSSKADLNSLCMDINTDNNKKMRLVATDKYRLSCANLDFEEFDSPCQIIIPKESVSEIIKLDPTTFFMNENKNHIFFKYDSPSGKFTFKTSTTNAKYPDISAYINNDFKKEIIKLKRSDIVSSLKRIKIVSEKLEKIATVEFIDKKIVLATENSSSKAKEEVSFKYEGEETLNAFKVKVDFLLDYLGEEDDEYISFKLIEGMCLVFEDSTYRHVLAIE